MGSVTGYTAEHMDELVNDTVIDASIVGNELILITRGGEEINLGPIVQGPNQESGSEVVILGKKGEFGTAPGLGETSTGERIETSGMDNFEFEPGMGPFFSQILPDGTVAMPQIQLPVNQLHNTGKNMAMSFWSKQEGAFYTVIVPTSMGAVEVLAVNSISGVVSEAGGADLSDCAVVTIAGQTVLFALSAFPYRGWNVETYGEYPVLAAFVKSDETGRWVYEEDLSIFPAELQASDPTYGEHAWPNTTNYYTQEVVTTKLPAEVAVLPQSGHLAIAIYGPRDGHNSGALVVVDPEAKTQAAYFEFEDFSSPSGATFRAFPRDLNADPTSDLNDERMLLNFDTFTQPNEMFNVVVNADSGTFQVSYDGDSTAELDVGTSQKEMLEALEGLPSIGAGNVKVKLFRPFLVSTYSVYEVELIDTLQATDLSAIDIEIDVDSLVDNNNSRIVRWQTGGSGFTKHAPFPMVEMSYNAGDGSIEQMTTLLLPHDASDSEDLPESIDAKFSHSWIDSNGTAWFSVRGTSANPQMITSYWFRGLHAFAKVAGERRYVTEHPPTALWNERFGEAQPYPDLMTNGLHRDNNAPILAVSEDQASGGIIASSSNGKLKIVDPTAGLAFRSVNLLGVESTEDWTVISGTGHTGIWDAGESALAMTAGSEEPMNARSAFGLSGVEIPAAYVGQLLQFYLEVKAETVGRLNVPVVRFYDEAGDEISVLSGYGSAYIESVTTEYKVIAGSTVVPEDTVYISFGVQVLDPEAGEIHYVKNAFLHLAACYPIADVNLDTYDRLYADATGGPWLAKGFVDPDTRLLYLPFLQQMASNLALNTRHPAWLIQVDLSSKLRDRRAIAAREPIPHAETHAIDGSDPLQFSVDNIIGAAPINDPEFTGRVGIANSEVEGPPDLFGSELPTAGLSWDSSLGLILVTSDAHRWRLGTSGNWIPVDHNTYDIGASTNRVKDLHLHGKLYLASTTMHISAGAGSPEGSVSAAIGSLWIDQTNGVLYIKASGASNTGWTVVGSNTIFNRQTASYALVLTDRGKTIEMDVAGANNLTVPTNASVAFPVGTKVYAIQRGAGLTTVVASGGVTVNSRGGLLNFNGQYSKVTLEKVAADEWYLSGDLA